MLEQIETAKNGPKPTEFFTAHRGSRQTSIHRQSLVKFCTDGTRTKSLLRRLKNIGMVSEKLYQNTLSARLRLGAMHGQLLATRTCDNARNINCYLLKGDILQLEK